MSKKDTLLIVEKELEKTTLVGCDIVKIYRYDINRLMYNASSHKELIGFIIVRNSLIDGMAPVSIVISEFISYCTDEDNSDSLYLSVDECKAFLKDNLGLVPFRLIHVSSGYNTQLVFKIDDYESIISFNLPMVCPPLDWELTSNANNGIKGGYVNNVDNIIPLMRVKPSMGKSRIILSKELIDIINRAQNVEYNVHSVYLSGIAHSREYNNKLEEIKKMNANEDNKANKRQYNILRNELDVLKIKIDAYDIINRAINAYDIRCLYFVPTICFRGRLYWTTLISPTGDKNLRELILPYNSTVESNILTMDATASILQILAVITLSVELAKVVNLIADERTDTWTYLHNRFINKSKDELSEILNSYFKDNPTSKRFSIDDIYDSLYIVDRSIVKYTIMRILYGSNSYQISVDFRSELALPKLSYKHILLVYASFIFHYKVESEALEIIRILNKGVTKADNEGLTIDNGYISFTNTYMKVTKEKIRFRDSNNVPHLVEVYLTNKNEIDVRKGNKAVNANLFHSIDSNICLSIIDRFTSINKFILTVHDSFTINGEDEDILFNEYNTRLYNNHNRLIEMIDNNIDRAKLSKRDLTTTRCYLNTLKERSTIFTKHKHNIISSRFTLKREFSTTTHNEFRHDITIPDDRIEDYLTSLARHVLDNKNIDKYGMVQVYSDSITFDTGYVQKISSRLHTINDIFKCIEEYLSKSEQYGDSENNSLDMRRCIRFSRLDADSINIVKDIEHRLNSKYEIDYKGNKLLMGLINILDSPLPYIIKEETITENTIKEPIITQPTVHDNTIELTTTDNETYNNAWKMYSKALIDGDKKKANSHNTNANQIAKRYGLERRHRDFIIIEDGKHMDMKEWKKDMKKNK